MLRHGGRTFGMLTGKRRELQISPNNALTALISELWH